MVFPILFTPKYFPGEERDITIFQMAMSSVAVVEIEKKTFHTVINEVIPI